LYAAPSWLASFFSSGRIYYGAFGRGLFQTVYSSGASMLELPMSGAWIVISILLAACGILDAHTISAIGFLGIAATIAAVTAFAASASLPPQYSGRGARVTLAVATILGKLQRSWSRTWGRRLRFHPTPEESYAKRWRARDQLRFQRADEASTLDSASLLRGLRDNLVRRGLPVAESDGFQSYDLRIICQFANLDVNAIREEDGSISLMCQTRFSGRPAPLGSFFITAPRAGVAVRSAAVSIAPNLGARVVEEPR
jgi:hypothetical protein